jgi:hypothetical protein
MCCNAFGVRTQNDRNSRSERKLKPNNPIVVSQRKKRTIRSRRVSRIVSFMEYLESRAALCDLRQGRIAADQELAIFMPALSFQCK